MRSRFLIVLAGVIAPLALVGTWLARSTERSGEALVRARLDESLGRAMQAIGYRWVDQRALLLRVAENPAVAAALRNGRDVLSGQDSSSVSAAALRRDWEALQGIADVATFRDVNGAARGTLAARATTASLAQPNAVLGAIPVRLTVYDVEAGTPLGSLDIGVRVSALLPAGIWWAGVGGSVLAVFDPASGVPVVPLPMGAELLARDRFHWDGDDWVVVRTDLDEPPMRLALAAPIGPFTQPFALAARQGSIALVVVLVAGLVLALVSTQRLTRPLVALAEGSDAVAGGDFDRQVVEDGPDEIRRVGRAFNVMTESLRRTLRRLSQREAVAAVGEFAASLAHEVRNPLTAIRLDLERARERADDPARAAELIDRALAEIDRLDATVAGSLRIARSGTLTLTPIDLAEPIEAAMRAAAPAFAARGATLDPLRQHATPIMVRGNAGALEQLFLNLLLNAAEALDRGARASVTIDSSSESVRVMVRDDGPGIPAEKLEAIFEPFYTTKPAGTGLGLSIARRIAAAHEGEITIRSTQGSGTSVTVTLAAERPA